MKHQEQTLKLNKNKLTLCYSLSDFYDKYAEERSLVRSLDRKQYLSALKQVFALIAQAMIETNRPYNPKVGLGRFGIVKRNPRKRKVDWNLSKIHDKIIYHRNSHSEGCYFRWHWEKSNKCFFRNKTLYSFSPVRSLKKSLYEHIIKLDKDPTKKSYDALRELPPYEN